MTTIACPSSQDAPPVGDAGAIEDVSSIDRGARDTSADDATLVDRADEDEADRSVDANPNNEGGDARIERMPDAMAPETSPCGDPGNGPREDVWAPDVGADASLDGGMADTSSGSADTGAANTDTSVASGSEASVPGLTHSLYCTADSPCPKPLICLGSGCDDVWECFSHFEAFTAHHPCPTDYAPYCGCDGVTFSAIRSCPDRPYDRLGRCEDGVNCDPTALRCSGEEPPCPEGQVRTVVDGHYGLCVPASMCQCEFVWECPHREKYACDPNSKRCQPLPRDAGAD